MSGVNLPIKVVFEMSRNNKKSNPNPFDSILTRVGAFLGIVISLIGIYLFYKSQTDLAPEISNLQTCPTVCTQSKSIEIFPAKTSEIYASWEYKNIPAGTKYSRTWSLDGIGPLVIYECVWDGAKNGFDTTLKPLWQAGGLPSGHWKIEFKVNEQSIYSRGFVIEENNKNVWKPPIVRKECRGQ
jgi:hypothetical protein